MPSKYPPKTRLTVGSHQVEIIKYISEGGFATVYTCHISPPFMGSSVACLKRVVVPSKWQLTLLRQEVDAMRRLRDNPYIVSYIDSHAARYNPSASAPTTPAQPQQYEVFLLMEYCENNGLIDFMNTRLVNKLTEPEILRIMYDTVTGVAMCHHLEPPLIHRDIKIENVLIDKHRTFKLADFGSAVPYLPPPQSSQELRLLRDDIMHHTTPQYRAPEMVDVTKGFPIDDKSDVWALGVLLYKLCFYTTPFESYGGLKQMESAILNVDRSLRFPKHPFSSRLITVIKCCLRADPRRRPTATQVLGEICAMRGVPVPNVVPTSVRKLHAQTHQMAPSSVPALATSPVRKASPSDPFASIDKSRLLRPKSVGAAEALEKPRSSTSAHSLQEYISQIQSTDNALRQSIDDQQSTLDFLRDNDRHNTGGSVKSAFRSLRRISTGGSMSSQHSGRRSSISSIKQILTGNSGSPEDDSPPPPPSIQGQLQSQPQGSVSSRMQKLLRSSMEVPRSAQGYGRYTDTPDDDIASINSAKTASKPTASKPAPKPAPKRRQPPPVPKSLRAPEGLQGVTIPSPPPLMGKDHLNKSATVPALKKTPPKKPKKPTHLKRAQTDDMLDIDAMEKSFAQRYPSYV
ncbi:hypothetical protein DIURU_000887 [Diutina rugosa]|uniref:non-specific serine/threonine protein kinase n=1 Tax=Diutina rugosa TaxID=5481 RepID=A0A642V236_DIURU|nr:uncharacterized protein DIURU_000887 [Diutina rugosa]KAA8907203.1 hypothetical protein DIURU_000887 [Diutina rugosa]